MLNHPQYNPNGLLDAVIAKLGLKNDAALARALEVLPPQISKIRNRRIPVGATLILRLIEAGMTLPTIRVFVPKVEV